MGFKLPNNFEVKPTEPHKTVITPSSLYKAFCHRCTWMSYWHNFSFPVNLALQLQMAALQEESYDGRENRLISQNLPSGKTYLHKGKFASIAIAIDGVQTRWKLYGALDLLSKNDNGTFSIIDGKVSMKKDAEGLANDYWKQLEAYAYMLEHPETGEPLPISTLGLIQWRITSTLNMDSELRGFKVEERYIPVERNPEGFIDFIADFIAIIEGEFPESSAKCTDCSLLQQVGIYK